LKSAVFLDRDGVVCMPIIRNGKPYPPSSTKELKIIQGLEEAAHSFYKANLEVVIITNQPDIGNGHTTFAEVNKINEKIMNKTGIEHFYICPHIESDSCLCRKPKAGLLIKSAFELGISLQKSYLIGDRWKDIEAGQKVGCDTYFIDYSYSEKKPTPPYTKVTSVLEASRIILNKIGADND